MHRRQASSRAPSHLGGDPTPQRACVALIKLWIGTQARVYAPPRSASLQWEQVGDLTDQLHGFMRSTNWQVCALSPARQLAKCVNCKAVMLLHVLHVHALGDVANTLKMAAAATTSVPEKDAFRVHSGATDNAEPLRLRGGGLHERSTQQQAASGGEMHTAAAAPESPSPADAVINAGSRVEVMNAEEGLQGCW